MLTDKQVRALFEKVSALDKLIPHIKSSRRLKQSQQDLAKSLEAIARYFMVLHYEDDPASSDPELVPLSINDKRQLEYIISHIRSMGDSGVSTSELRDLSRVIRRHLEAGIPLPTYMAERGIRLRKSGKSWLYIHEDWDF